MSYVVIGIGKSGKFEKLSDEWAYKYTKALKEKEAPEVEAKIIQSHMVDKAIEDNNRMLQQRKQK